MRALVFGISQLCNLYTDRKFIDHFMFLYWRNIDSDLFLYPVSDDLSGDNSTESSDIDGEDSFSSSDEDDLEFTTIFSTDADAERRETRTMQDKNNTRNMIDEAEILNKTLSTFDIIFIFNIPLSFS